MNIVLMKHSHGACCMTAELCAFTALKDEWFDRQKRYYKNTETPDVLHNVFRVDCTPLLEKGRQYFNDHFYGMGDTVEEAWANALQQVQESVNRYSYAGKQVRYFWFVRHEGNDGYDNEELRNIVSNIPGVVKLGNYVNANSRNEVDGYMVVFTNENGNEYPEDEDNE